MKGAYQPCCLVDDYQTNKEGLHMSFSSAVRELSQLPVFYQERDISEKSFLQE